MVETTKQDVYIAPTVRIWLKFQYSNHQEAEHLNIEFIWIPDILDL